jgi:hypothetical protein
MGRKYYEEPTQVVFIENMEDDKPRKIGGIAYQDYIICGECGGVVKIEDTEIVKELPWYTISEDIGGYEIY